MSDARNNVRVMTFNICGSEPEGANGWPDRAALNVSTIKRYDPHLIGFQELEAGNLRTYEVELSEYDHVRGPKYTNDEPYNYPSIFWKQSRFHLVDSGGFWLSRTPDRYSGDWGAAAVRSATWANLRDRQTGHVVSHWNTHLDNKSDVARAEGAKLMLLKIEQIGTAGAPVILTADFNSAPRSLVYRLFLEAGCVDTFLATGNADSEDTFTYHRNKGESYIPRPRMDPRLRIDWILTLDRAQRIRAKSCIIARDHDDPLYPSDHYPVIAELDILG